MANPIRYYPCPACGSALSMNSSRMITGTMREQYAQCDNAQCGGGFVIRSEIVTQLSPTSDLFAAKVQNLPKFDDLNKIAWDLAIEFLGRQWQSNLTTDERMIECRKYLQENLQITNDRADLIVRLALADWDAAGLELWGVDTTSTKDRTAVVVYEGMTQKHVLSLRELVELIKSKQTNQLI